MEQRRYGRQDPPPQRENCFCVAGDLEVTRELSLLDEYRLELEAEGTNEEIRSWTVCWKSYLNVSIHPVTSNNETD